MGCNFSGWWRWKPTIVKDSVHLSSMEACVRVSSKLIFALTLICQCNPPLYNSKWRLADFKIVQSDFTSNPRFSAVATLGCNPALIKAFCGKLNLHAHPSKRRRGTTSWAFPIPHTCLAPLLHCQLDQSLPRPALPRGYQKDRRYPRGHSTHSHWE